MNFGRWNLAARALAWRRYIEKSLSALHLEINALKKATLASEKRINDLEEKCSRLEADVIDLSASIRTIWSTSLNKSEPVAEFFSEPFRIGLSRRGKVVRLIAFPAKSHWVGKIWTDLSEEVIDEISAGRITEFYAANIGTIGIRQEWKALPDLLQQMIESPQFFRTVLRAFENKPVAKTWESEDAEVTVFRHTRDALTKDLDLIDFMIPLRRGSDRPPPFEDRDSLPPYRLPAAPKKRSVVLLHNNYYHFKHLSESLKMRGWDAVSVSLASPNSKEQKFYQGEDLNLYDPDPLRMRDQVGAFFRTVPERFEALHFYGEGVPSFFVENYEYESSNKKIPWDFLEIKRHRTVIGYTPSGCLGGTLQSSIHRVSYGVCDRCVWQLRPEVCSDAVNRAWIDKVDLLCDWIGLEGDWVTPEREGSRFVRDPVVMALDPDKWRPDLEVPPQFKIEKKPGEFLVYHAVGNYESRRQGDRDIKGTGAVQAAIARLQEEGVPVRLFFATDIPSKDVRFFQVQADIVIDQLNYGRLGANSRESLMLGRPLITSVRAGQNVASPYLLEIPAVNASEASIYQELKMLLSDPQHRERLKNRGRAFALKWHASDVCALRFEKVIDQVKGKLPLDISDVFVEK